MITNRRDYRFVDIPTSIEIDGGIIPLREDKNILRGEDPSFIQEAFAEREYVRHGCYAAPSFEMDKRILGSRYQTVIDGYRDWLHIAPHDDGKPIDPNFEPQEWYFAQSEYSLFSPCEIDSSAILLDSSFMADSTAFRRGSPVKLQPIVDVYNDLRKLTAFQVYIPQYGLLTNATYTRETQGKFDVSFHIEPPYIWRWYTGLDWDGDIQIWAAETKTLNSATFHFSTESDFPDWLSEAKIWVGLYFAWYTRDNPSGAWSSHYRTYFVPMTATRHYDGYTVNLSDLLNHFEVIKDQLPIKWNPLDYNGGCYRAECSIFANWVTAKLGDHTKWWTD